MPYVLAAVLACPPLHVPLGVLMPGLGTPALGGTFLSARRAA
ncbi:hypothetical protein ABZ318_02555 [Streptomyces sp. NPDC006197]